MTNLAAEKGSGQLSASRGLAAKASHASSRRSMPDVSAALFFAGEGLKLCMHARCWIDSWPEIARRGTCSHALATQSVNGAEEANQCLPDASCLETIFALVSSL